MITKPFKRSKQLTVTESITKTTYEITNMTVPVRATEYSCPSVTLITDL